MSEWFETWFDSEFYHILYKNRDQHEAEQFLNNLIAAIPIDKNQRILDLACGTGRHANYLSGLGYKVLGTDLSSHNIKLAQSHSSNHNKARFKVHDMRNPLEGEVFDIVLNLFTSFGYFNRPEDNLRSLRAMRGNLNDGGTLVIDFFNAVKLCASLPAEEVKLVDDVLFKINKELVGGVVKKSIDILSNGKEHHHKEEVQVLNLLDFTDLMRQAGFKILRTFGNYNLDAFGSDSDRLILVATKI